jgi:hypothetical protein
VVGEVDVTVPSGSSNPTQITEVIQTRLMAVNAGVLECRRI